MCVGGKEPFSSTYVSGEVIIIEVGLKEFSASLS